MIQDAKLHLRTAAKLHIPGRYQTEAAIQSFHPARLFTDEVNPAVLVDLYDVLVLQTHCLGAKESHTAAYLREQDEPPRIIVLGFLV